MLKYTLLGFLTYQPMTGYELKQRMDRSTNHFWHARLSQIYVTLKAMEEEELVASTIHEQQERPDRRVYQITPAGLADFDQWLAQPETELAPKKEFLLLKLFFAARLDRRALLAQLTLQRDLHRRQAAYYHTEIASAVRQAEKAYPTLARDARFWEASRRFGEEYEALYTRWLEEMIDMVETEEQGSEEAS